MQSNRGDEESLWATVGWKSGKEVYKELEMRLAQEPIETVVLVTSLMGRGQS